MKTVYVINVVYNNRLTSTWCYIDRNKAMTEYNALCDAKRPLIKSPKETHENLGLFGDSFTKTFSGRYIESGYKTYSHIEITLSGREINMMSK